MSPDKDTLRTRSTADDPLTKNQNVLSLEGVRVKPQNPMVPAYLNISSPPTPAPSPQPVMSEPTTSSSGSSATTIVTGSAPTSHDLTAKAIAWSSLAPTHLHNLPSSALDFLLMSALPHLTPAQLTHLASVLPPHLKRDFLADLPPEIALHILSFVDDVKTLARAGSVSRTWRVLVNDDAPWKIMCAKRGFEVEQVDRQMSTHGNAPSHQGLSDTSGPLASVRNLWAASPREDTPSKRHSVRKGSRSASQPSQAQQPFSFRKYFKTTYLTESNWRRSGRLLRSHRSQDAGVVTSLAMDGQWIVVGLANSRVHVFSASTGVLARTLIGHEAGVWSLWLVSKGGGLSHPKAEQTSVTTEESDSSWEPQEEESWASMIPQSLRVGIGLGTTSPAASLSGSSTSSASSGDMPFQSVFDSLRPRPGDSDGVFTENDDPSSQQSDPCNASRGWGQANALVVSGGCDKQLRVWDVKSGYCLYVLRGHRSTVRCIKIFHGRPVAVSGGRDHTLRVWDIQKGTLLRTLEGHTDSVRCLDVFGDQVVSGSYDCSVRLWNVDTGECLRVFNGHYHQVYTVAFDGERIVSGGLDTTVRVWSASTGTCLALLQGHTTLVCQLQLSSLTNTVVTGSADGRIIIFSIAPASSHVRTTTSRSVSVAAAPLEFSIAPASSHVRTSTTTSRSVSVAAAPLESDGPASPPLSPSMAAVDNTDVHDVEGRDVSGYHILARVPAHSSSVTGLQFDDRPGRRRVVSGGNDGRVQLWEFTDGSDSGSEGGLAVQTCDGNSRTSHSSWASEMRLVRDLTEPCEGLWKVAFRGDQAVICCLRSGRTVLEIWSFRPVEEDL